MRRAMAVVLSLFLAVGVVATAPVAAVAAPAGHGHGDDAHEHAHDDHHGPSMLAMFVNTAILAGVLIYVLRKPASNFFRTRKEELQQALSAAERAREEAEAKLVEAKAQLEEAGARAKEIVEGATTQAATERENLLADAERQATAVLEQAQAQVGELETSAQRRLRRLAADLSVELARELIAKEMTAKDRGRLLEQYLEELEQAPS